MALPTGAKPGAEHCRAFLNHFSVHIVPVEPQEMDLALEELDDGWSAEAMHEAMAWDDMAELGTQGCPLPPIEEEPQEEETR